jgi:hypothetical protein
MSSTNRSDSRDYHISDYYITPIEVIKEFLNKFIEIEGKYIFKAVLDPCAGGDVNHPMSYPSALELFGIKGNIDTVDIREDSLAQLKADYLKLNIEKQKYNVIITNPPFNYALEIIEKALNDVTEDGFVIMLLRLNFLGSKKRKPFWDANPPKYIFVHSKRISFFGNTTDSIEYAHFVWQKNNKNPTQLFII